MIGGPPIIDFLSNPSRLSDRRTRAFTTQFILIDGELFKKGIDDDALLQCLRKIEAMRVMAEVNEGIYEAHQVGLIMKWLLRRHNCYWLGMLKDCISYARGC